MYSLFNWNCSLLPWIPFPVMFSLGTLSCILIVVTYIMKIEEQLSQQWKKSIKFPLGYKIPYLNLHDQLDPLLLKFISEKENL